MSFERLIIKEKKKHTKAEWRRRNIQTHNLKDKFSTSSMKCRKQKNQEETNLQKYNPKVWAGFWADFFLYFNGRSEMWFYFSLCRSLLVMLVLTLMWSASCMVQSSFWSARWILYRCWERSNVVDKYKFSYSIMVCVHKFDTSWITYLFNIGTVMCL